MTDQETYLLIGALVGLLGAIQAWIVSKTVQHGRALNGEMDDRIHLLAKAAVANDHAVRGETPSPATNAATQARIAALRAELETLDPTSAPVVVPPVVLARPK